MFTPYRELSGGHRMYLITSKITGELGNTPLPEDVGKEVPCTVQRRF